MGNPISKPEPKNFNALLIDTSCYVIPDYQREYTWKHEDQWRLLETIVHDINSNKELTFLGSIILSDGTKRATHSVCNIVDGQQRTISLLFTLFCLYKVINTMIEQANNLTEGEKIALISKRDEISKKLRRRCQLIERQRHNTLDLYMQYILKSLPNGIDKNIAQDSISLKPKDFKDKQQEESFLVRSLQHVLSIKDYVKIDSKIFSRLVEYEERKGLKIRSAQYKTEAARVIAFVEHMFERINFVEVVVSEDYSYDVFERFNTAGDPLTAFETFKPLVFHDIEDHRINKNYKQKINDIADILEQWSQGKNRDETRAKTNKNTQNFVIWFCYLYSGGISKNNPHEKYGVDQGKQKKENGSYITGVSRKSVETGLAAQRSYLRNCYVNKTQKEKEHFIDVMLDLAQFIQQAWAPDNNNLDSNYFKPDDCKSLDEYKKYFDEAAFCLDFLRDLGHTIAVPLSAYFFRKFIDHKTLENLINFSDCVKCCAAFFCIWRSSRPTTGSIENRYRDIYFNTYDDDEKRGVKNLPHKPLFEFLFDKRGSMFSISLLKAHFKYHLQHGKSYAVSSSSEWAKRLHPICIGDTESGLKKVSKFILLAASHDKYLSKSLPSFELAKKLGYKAIIDDYSWSRDAYKTVEHLVPVERGKKRITDKQKHQLNIIDDDECRNIIHSLGNLTLLPKKINSKLKDAQIDKKIELIKSLEDDPNVEHLPLLEFLKHIQPQNFDHKYISARAEELARCAWDILAVKWLGWRRSK